MSRDLQHKLHTRLQLATEMLDLPLDAQHLERLAVELTPAVQALLAEQADTDATTVPVRYAVVAGTETDETAGVRTTTYAQCTSRIDTAVDEQSPAALLAAEFRARQPDVLATDVPTATYLGLTVRPQSLTAWRWWLDKLGVHPDTVTVQGTAAHATGAVGDVVVALQGDEVPLLLVDESAARLMGLLAETAS